MQVRILLPPQLGMLFFALFSDSFNKNIEMSAVSFCCFYIPINKTAHGRCGLLYVPSTPYS